MRESMTAGGSPERFARSSVVRAWWPWLIVAALSIASLSTLLLSDRALRIVVPAMFALHALVITFGIRRRTDRDPVTWLALQIGIILLVPRSFAFVQYRQGNQDQRWQTATVAALLAILVCFGWAGTRGFRPLLHVPGTARPVRVGLIGFVLVSVSAQWTFLGERPTGRAWEAAALACSVGTAALIAAFAMLADDLRQLGRHAELMIVGAAGVYGFGQAVELFGSDRVVPTSHVFAHTLVATSLVAVASLRDDMVRVGQPVVQLTDRPLTNVSPAVLLTISVADAALVGVARGPWGVSQVVFVMAVVVAIQMVVIVWLSGLLLGMLGRLGKFRNRRLKQELRGAVARCELEAHFQPIISVSDHAVVGYETLARWPHDRLGMLTAARFISLASSEGYLASIDSMMIRCAAEALPALFATTSGQAPFLTVNVEPRRMQEAGFAARTLADLSSASLDPRGLVIELTETSAVDDWEELRSNVALFKAAGVGLAIDDFGAGHSNFGLLVELDPDLVKLDQTLITAALNSDRGRSVVRNAVAAARSAGARIVAEGVSNAEWKGVLEELGFDHMQGYAFGKADSVASYAGTGGVA
jgi:EAL domain-containing protein (putative c-di-GMP-specific phosphodiesterase class I)